MGRIARVRRQRREGRTVRVFNDRSGEYETFHGVKVSDQAVREWVEDRWLSVAAGNPNRPPDRDTRHFRAWQPRPGEPQPVAADALIEDLSCLIRFWRTEPFTVGVVALSRPDANGEAVGFTVSGERVVALRGVAKGAVETVLSRYRARVRVQYESIGVAGRAERDFDTEASACAWVEAHLEEVTGTSGALRSLSREEVRAELAEVA
jgi:hypothetical protein